MARRNLTTQLWQRRSVNAGLEPPRRVLGRGRRRAGPRSENDRYGALVDQLDLHVGAEHAGFDVEPATAERLAKALVERLRLLGRRRTREARSAPLRGIGDERELR